MVEEVVILVICFMGSVQSFMTGLKAQISAVCKLFLYRKKFLTSRGDFQTNGEIFFRING